MCRGPVVTFGRLSAATQRLRLDAEDASLQGDTRSEVSPALWGSRVGGWVEGLSVYVRTHKGPCVSMCTVRGGVRQGSNGSQWTGVWRTGPCGRRRGDGDGGRCWWQQPANEEPSEAPFTLNMGHCCCPDLGFDPQRCVTSCFSPRVPPPRHLDSTHAYVNIRAHAYAHVC